MYCPTCGAQNDPKQDYCRQCGQSMSGVRLAVQGNAGQSLQKLKAGQKWVNAGAATLVAFTLIGLAIAIPGIASNNPALSNIAIINLLLGSLIGLPLIYVGKASVKRAARLLSKSEVQSLHSSADQTAQSGRLLTTDLNSEPLKVSVPGSVTEHTTLNLVESPRRPKM